MSSESKAVFEAALSLSPDDRAELADELWISLDTAHQAEVEAARNAILEKRLDELDRGVAGLVPAEEVFRQMGERHK